MLIPAVYDYFSMSLVQALFKLYLNGVDVGSRTIPDWSPPLASQLSGSMHCEIGSENLAPGGLHVQSVPEETEAQSVDMFDDTTPIVEAQEAYMRAVSVRSVESSEGILSCTLLVSNALVFNGKTDFTIYFLCLVLLQSISLLKYHQVRCISVAGLTVGYENEQHFHLQKAVLQRIWHCFVLYFPSCPMNFQLGNSLHSRVNKAKTKIKQT